MARFVSKARECIADIHGFGLALISIGDTASGYKTMNVLLRDRRKAAFLSLCVFSLMLDLKQSGRHADMGYVTCSF